MGRRKKESAATFVSIGKAVNRLREVYTELSISKVRYLEDQGLLKLNRTKGGYRLFSNEDISKLAEILRLQREQFLPLTIIKERMISWKYNGGDLLKSPGEAGDSKEDQRKKKAVLQDILNATDLGPDTVATLKNFGLVEITEDKDGSLVGPEDTEILTIFAKLMKFGIEPRHLRMYENLAQRETLLFQQILTPQIKHKSQKLRKKSLGDLKELVALTERIRRGILKKSLREAQLIQ